MENGASEPASRADRYGDPAPPAEAAGLRGAMSLDRAEWFEDTLGALGASSPGWLVNRDRRLWSAFKRWQPLEPDTAWAIARGMKERYPDREVLPFARRVDTDDIAVFVLSDLTIRRGAITVIEDFAPSGWECGYTYNTFDDWLRAAREDEER